jgi:hypothetical protein
LIASSFSEILSKMKMPLKKETKKLPKRVPLPKISGSEGK